MGLGLKAENSPKSWLKNIKSYKRDSMLAKHNLKQGNQVFKQEHLCT